MADIKITLSEDQYRTLIDFLYFSDFCAWHSLISGFKTGDKAKRQQLSDLIEIIYAAGDELGLPKSISLNSLASKVPFSDEDAVSRMHQVEHDLKAIAQIINL